MERSLCVGFRVAFLSGFVCETQVCREYQRGNCTRGENDCRFAHPADSTMIDTNDNTVTVCMDYIKGRCSREKCKYFHPPTHLQAKIKAAQHQVNQAAAAAALVGIPVHTTTTSSSSETSQTKYHTSLHSTCSILALTFQLVSQL